MCYNSSLLGCLRKEGFSMLNLSERAKNAVLIGTLCSVSYLAVYVARNVLSAVTPYIISGGEYDKEYIGAISSLYFIFYAVGQLINGAIGDKIKARYMISFGLFLAGVTNFVFPWIIQYKIGATLVYSMTGFFLSMIYGPMTKVVSENTDPIHTTRCSLGYTLASFLGSPMAGFLAFILVWQGVFIASSAFLFSMAIVCFTTFCLFERRGIVKYGQYKAEKKGSANVKVLFEHKIVKYALISVITGVVRTSVVFWLPTYLNEYLGFSEDTSSVVYIIGTLAISATAFIAIFTYERLKRDMEKTVLIMFISSTLFFMLTYFVTNPILNVVCIILAIMSSNGAACMLWSRYCPSLRDTGMVSSVTGFLDFLSYMAAAASNLVFANASSAIGWGNLILVWLGLILIGVIISLPYDKFRKGALRG